MHIKHVEIFNFRKLLSVRIDFADQTTLFVGANNSGKTSAMLALRRFLTARSQRFETHDISLSHWGGINALGQGWLDTRQGDDKPDLSSAASGNLGNAAGIVEFCIKNNYLSGDAASSVKDKLMGKLGGDSESDTDKAGYADGAKGLLKTGDGGSFDLAQLGGLKKSVTEKACSSVLDHAKSFL